MYLTLITCRRLIGRQRMNGVELYKSGKTCVRIKSASTMLKALIVLLGVTGVYGKFSKIKNVYYKYDALLLNGFYHLPKTPSDDEGFQFVTHDEELNCDVYSHRNDPRFFILFDSYGNVAGVRTGYIKSDLPKKAEKNNLEFPYKFEDHKTYESGTFWDTDIYYATILFDDPEVFKKGGVQDTKGIVVRDVYLKLKGVWTKISRDQCDAEKMGFNKQGCFIGMGQHYFYKTTKTTDCHDFEGVFLLYESGELVGLGIIPFGSFTKGVWKDWFEDPPVLAVEAIVPNRPKCLTEWVSKYGTTSMHIYFKRNPQLISCLFPFQKPLHCR